MRCSLHAYPQASAVRAWGGDRLRMTTRSGHEVSNSGAKHGASLELDSKQDRNNDMIIDGHLSLQTARELAIQLVVTCSASRPSIFFLLFCRLTKRAELRPGLAPHKQPTNAIILLNRPQTMALRKTLKCSEVLTSRNLKSPAQTSPRACQAPLHVPIQAARTAAHVEAIL